MPNISLTAPTDYAAQQADIERRRQYAQLLTQQSMQGTPTETAGGMAVPTSWTQHAAKILQGYLGGAGQKQATEQSLALAQALRGDRQKTIESAMGVMNGSPESYAGDASVPGDSVHTPAVAPNPQAAYGILAGSADPSLAAAGTSAMLKGMEPFNLRQGEVRMGPGGVPLATNPKPPEAFSLSPGQTRYGPDGKPIVAAAEAPYTMSPGQVRIGADGKPLLSVADKPTPLMQAITAAGIDPKSPEAVALFKAEAAKLTTHAPAASQTVINSGPKAFETELGKLDAEQLGKYRDGAQAGQQTLGIVENLRGAIQQGVYSGGAAQAKTAVANMINGITGFTPKGLPGSQLFNAEASKLVLEKIKTLGSNPSNADRVFIEKTVPMLSTSPEARDALIAFLEQRAGQSIDLYQRADAHARANHGLGGFNAIQAPSRRASDKPGAVLRFDAHGNPVQ